MILLSHIDNYICGLDFNPLGTSVASIDDNGVCLISDMITNDYIYHIDANSKGISTLLIKFDYKITSYLT